MPQTNVPEMSVSELSFALKRTLEDTFGRVRVRGGAFTGKDPYVRPYVFGS